MARQAQGLQHIANAIAGTHLATWPVARTSLWMALTEMQPPNEQPAMNICLPLKPFMPQLSSDLHQLVHLQPLGDS